MGSYSILQQILLLERVFTFQPDAVYFVATPTDAHRALVHLVQQVRRGMEIPFEAVAEIAEEAGLSSDLRETEAMRRMQPHADEILDWALADFASRVRARGATPVWVYLYLPQQDDVEHADVRALERRDGDAGFLTLDLFDVYDGQDLDALAASLYDRHPNAAGHRVIADRLFRELTTREQLGLPLDQPTSEGER